MSECCDECDYWEDKADIFIENQIKASSLDAAFAKKNLVNKLTNIKAPSLTHKARRVVVKNTNSLLGTDNEKVQSEVGTNSSQ
mgnify:CR=1 FL=1|jgi:ribosome recycling factor|tara:strand:+ start:550 stop:798 length:249 start_codon:yes stop_codon:yes gene_type:complete